eukprot:16441812-Heterocapsa_arctica.AAC.1
MVGVSCPVMSLQSMGTVRRSWSTERFRAMSVPRRFVRAELGKPGLADGLGSICPMRSEESRDGASVTTEEASSPMPRGECGGVERSELGSVLPSVEKRVP